MKMSGLDAKMGETLFGSPRIEGATPQPGRGERRVNPGTPQLKQKKEWSIRPLPSK